MCIRDRRDCVKPSSPSKQVYSIDISPISAVQVTPIVSASVFIEPVSYTHLDVYKRQRYDNYILALKSYRDSGK